MIVTTLMMALILTAASAVAPTPTRTSTTVPSATPYPTYTVAPSQTPRATYTPYPSPTVAPTATQIPTGSRGGGTSGKPPGFCVVTCWDWGDFFGSIGAGIVEWLLGGVTTIVRAFADLMAGVVRVDQWSAISGFFAFMLTVGGGVALGLTIVGAFLYQRSMLPGGNPKDGALGLGLLNRTLETAVLLGGLGWGVGQLFELAARLVDSAVAYSGVVAADALIGLVNVFVGDGAVLNPINDVMGVVAFVVYLLIVLVKCASVAALAWLVVIAPLAIATWPLGAAVAARWLSSLVSVLLWGLGWAVWLMLAGAVLTDWTLPAILKPFIVVALLLFGYGVPRMVDHLLGSAMARLSGASVGTDFAIGAAAGAASGGLSRQLGAGARQLLRVMR